MNVMTRVRSLWYASTCRSNISRACSANVPGTPAGWSNAGSSRSICSSARWMRRSMSRTASRYSVNLPASLGPRPRRTSPILSTTESSRLRLLFRRTARTAGSVLPPSPNIRSKTTRGLCSIGSGRGRPAPRQRVAVGAAIAAVARARALVARLQRQLQRAELRFAAELGREQLVHRYVRPEVVALLAERPRDGAGQVLGRAAPVHGAALGRQAVLVLGQAAQDQQAVAERFQRFENRFELEGRALQRRGPLVDDHPVRDVHHAETLDRPRRRAAQRGQGRHHAVEQRQGDSCADAAQHRAARQRLAGDDHDSDLRIWNGVLRAMPRMIADQR